MSIAMSLIYQRWTETVGIDCNLSVFKERCELYDIGEKDEMHIRELEQTHDMSVVQMIKGDLTQSITELPKMYGFTTQERIKWSQFFFGAKVVYESICPECKNAHIHYSKTNASVVCAICRSPRCVVCGKQYERTRTKNAQIDEKCCSVKCSSKMQQKTKKKTLKSLLLHFLPTAKG